MFLHLKEPNHETAMLIDMNGARREMFHLMLGSRDMALSDTCASIHQAIVCGSDPDLILLYVETVDDTTLADLARLRGVKTAAILALVEAVSQKDIDLLLEHGADHVLPLGLQSDRFFVATVTAGAQARKRQRLEEDAAGAKRALDEARRIARAKMILIARHGIGEEEAHRRVQKLSMERNLPLAEMAGQIIAAENLLC